MQVSVLGSAAGGGFPQWNCVCSNCSGLRTGTLRGKPRSQAQVAISLDRHRWFLLNASPDLRSQIEATPNLHPRARVDAERFRSSPVAAVILTSGDLDNVLGLLLLREFQPFEIYATRTIRQALTLGNTFFRMLERVRPQAGWHDIVPGQGFDLGTDQAQSAVVCEPIPLRGGYPEYVTPEDSAGLCAGEALIALEIQAVSSGRKMIYCPTLPELSADLLARFAACDLLLLDGTFWADDELIRVAGTDRAAKQMGHVPISGSNGSLERLRNITRPHKVYTHINNTNPILDEDSPEFAQVISAGWSVAWDDMQFDL